MDAFNVKTFLMQRLIFKEYLQKEITIVISYFAGHGTKFMSVYMELQYVSTKIRRVPRVHLKYTTRERDQSTSEEVRLKSPLTIPKRSMYLESSEYAYLTFISRNS